ncbi:hypothetical protein HYH02_006425 [Chlamydomonas schloesseri]|uniref:Uncharacterized protein n=1 Tax=Chlamydomonas schloesseri TaxID=2026947 RepID=A0A835WJT0_9CHLO|nr:hypothetical protein HYH02_006425 [Chlamydomonas schloesseri]|eukprot:KAG2448534.1 hypothetical protein HYH02_006425 [Chlamydomonas schloesseri]
MEYASSGDAGSAHGFELRPRSGAGEPPAGPLRHSAAPAPAGDPAAGTSVKQLASSYWRPACREAAAQDSSAQLGRPLTWQSAPTHIAAASSGAPLPTAAACTSVSRHQQPEQPAATGGSDSGSARRGPGSGDVGRPPPGPSRPASAAAAPTQAHVAPAQLRWPAQAQQLAQSPVLCGEQLVWPGEPRPTSEGCATAATAAPGTAPALAGPLPIGVPAASGGGAALTAADVDLSGSFAFAPSAGASVPEAHGSGGWQGRPSVAGTDMGTLPRRHSGTPHSFNGSGRAPVGRATRGGAGDAVAHSAAIAAAAAAAALQQQQRQQQQLQQPGRSADVHTQQQRPQQRSSQRVKRSKAAADGAQQLAAAAMPPPAAKAATARGSSRNSGSRSSATPSASDASASIQAAGGHGQPSSFTAGARGSGSHSAAGGASAEGSGTLFYDAAIANRLPQDGPLAGLINLRSPPGVARITGNSIKCVLGGDATAAVAASGAHQSVMAPGPPLAQPGFSFLPFGGAGGADMAGTAVGRSTASAPPGAVGSSNGSTAAANAAPQTAAAAGAAAPAHIATNVAAGSSGAGAGHEFATAAWLQRSYSDALQQPGELRAVQQSYGGTALDPFQAAHLHHPPPPAGLSPPPGGSGEVAYLPVIYHAGFPAQPLPAQPHQQPHRQQHQLHHQQPQASRPQQPLSMRRQSPEQQHQQPQSQRQPEQRQQAEPEPQPAGQYANYCPPAAAQQPAQVLASQPSLPCPHPAQQGLYGLGQPQQPQPHYPAYALHDPGYGQYLYPAGGQPAVAPPPQLSYYAYSGGGGGVGGGGAGGGGYEAYPQMWYYAVPAATGATAAANAPSDAYGYPQLASAANSGGYYAGGNWAVEASAAGGAAGGAAGPGGSTSSLYEQYSGPLGDQMQPPGQGGGGGGGGVDALAAAHRPAAGSQPTASPFRMGPSQAAGERDGGQQAPAYGFYAGEAAAAAAPYAGCQQQLYPQQQQQQQEQQQQLGAEHHHQQEPQPHDHHQRRQMAWSGPTAAQQGTAMYPPQLPAPASTAAGHARLAFEQQVQGTQAPTQPDSQQPLEASSYMLELPDLCLLMDIGSPGSFRQPRRVSTDGSGGCAGVGGARAGAAGAAATPARSDAAAAADGGSISPLALAALLGSPAVLSRRSSLTLNLSRHDAAAAAATQGWLSPLPGLNRAAAKPPAAAAAPPAGPHAAAAAETTARARGSTAAGGPAVENDALPQASRPAGRQGAADGGRRRATAPRRAASAALGADVEGPAAAPTSTRQRRSSRQRAPSLPAVSADGPPKAAGLASGPQPAGPAPAPAAAAAGAVALQPAAATIASAAAAADAADSNALSVAVTSARARAAAGAAAAAPCGVSPPRGAVPSEEPADSMMMSLFGGRDEDYNIYGSPGGLGGLGLGLGLGGLGMGNQWSLTPLRSPASLLVPGWRSTLPSALTGFAADGSAAGGGNGSHSTAEGVEQQPQSGLHVSRRPQQAASPQRQQHVHPSQRGAGGPVGNEESPGVLVLLRSSRMDGGAAGGGLTTGAAATVDAPGGVVVAPASAAGPAFTRVAEPEAYLLRPAGGGLEDAAAALMPAQPYEHPPPPRKPTHLSTEGAACVQGSEGKQRAGAAVAAAPEQHAAGQDASAVPPKRAMLRRRGRLLQSEMDRAAQAADAGAADAEVAAGKLPLPAAPRRAAAVAAAAAIARQAESTDHGWETATATASAQDPASCLPTGSQPALSEERTVTIEAVPAKQDASVDPGAVESVPPASGCGKASRGAQGTAAGGPTARGKRPRSTSAPAASASVQAPVSAAAAAVPPVAAIGKKPPAGSAGSRMHRERAPAPPPKPVAAQPPAAQLPATQRAAAALQIKDSGISASGTSHIPEAPKAASATLSQRTQLKQGRAQPLPIDAQKQQGTPPPAKRRRQESKPAAAAPAAVVQGTKAPASDAKKPAAITASEAAAAVPTRHQPRHPQTLLDSRASSELRGPQPQSAAPAAERATGVVQHVTAVGKSCPAAPHPEAVRPSAMLAGAAQPAAPGCGLAAAPDPTAASRTHAPPSQAHQALANQMTTMELASSGGAATAHGARTVPGAAVPQGAAPQASVPAVDMEPTAVQLPKSQAPSTAASQQLQEQQREAQQPEHPVEEPLPQLPHKKRLLLQREKERTCPALLPTPAQLPAGAAAAGASVASTALQPAPSSGAPAPMCVMAAGPQPLEPFACAAKPTADVVEPPTTFGAATGTQPAPQRRKGPRLLPERAGRGMSPAAGGPAAADPGAGPSEMRGPDVDDASASGGQGRVERNSLAASLLVVQPRAAAVRAAAAIAGNAKVAAKPTSANGQSGGSKKRGAASASEGGGNAPARKRQAVDASGSNGAAGAAASGSGAPCSGRRRNGAGPEPLPGPPPSPQAAAAAEALTALGAGAGRGRGAGAGTSRPPGAGGGGGAAAARTKPAARSGGQSAASQGRGRGRGAPHASRASGGAGGSGSAAGGSSSAAGPGGYTASAPVPQARARAAAAAAHEEAVTNPKKKGTIRRPGQIPNVVAAAASILLQLKPGVKAFEKTFRQEFGNNPDTSKALRLLMERGHVVRSGRGFRCDPYGYTVTQEGLAAAEEQRRREREAGADN